MASTTRLFVVIATFAVFAAAALGQQVRLAWDANSETDLAGYRMYRASASGGPYNLVGEIPCSGGDASCATFTDTGIAFDTTYYYIVRAFSVLGMESGNSNEVSALVPSLVDPDPDPVPPAAPTGLEVTEQGVNVQARWSPVPDIEFYGVFYRSPGASSFELLDVTREIVWSTRMPPGQRRGGTLGIASLDNDVFSALITYTFQ